MKYLLVLLSLLLLLSNIPLKQIHADKENKLPLAPCMPTDATLIKMSGVAEFGEEWIQVIRTHQEFYALKGEPIAWLGYAPRGQESKEWHGEEYGFGGVNMFLYGEQSLIELYNKDKELAGRIEVHEYPSTDEYILFFTTTYKFGRSDGSRYSFHIPAYPNTQNGTACMFRVDEIEFERALGWRKQE